MFCQTVSPIDQEELSWNLNAYRSPEVSRFTIRDRYLAMSVLQKAIRRNELELALSAGEFLRDAYPKQFWQRIQVIAIEDIGLANLKLVAQVLELSKAHSRWGVSEGPQKISSYLIEKLCASQKDRSADDLFDVLSRDPAHAIDCTNLADKGETGEGAVQFADDIFGRALSLIPPSQQNGEVPSRLVRIDEWVHKMELASFLLSCSVVSVASQAVRQTRSILAPMIAALSPEFPDAAENVDDELLPVLWHRSLPTWACGQHTRVGLAGLNEYARRSGRAAAILQKGKTGQVSSSRVLGGLLFRIECGQLSRRVKWDLGSELKSKATMLGWGLGNEFVSDLLNAMIEEWDLLNECRLTALQNYLR